MNPVLWWAATAAALIYGLWRFVETGDTKTVVVPAILAIYFAAQALSPIEDPDGDADVTSSEVLGDEE